MTNKKLCISSLILTTLTMAWLWGCQPASLAGRGVIGTGETTLKLVAEYKKNDLADISADGRLLLFYQTNIPMRSHTIPLDGRRGKANQPPVSDDVLRVVERESGREIGRVRVEFFPLEERFVPGAQQVFYGEPKPRSGGKWQYKLWDVASGQTRMCLDAPEGNFSSATFLDQQHALGIVSQKEDELLGRLALADCTRTIISTADPTDPKKGFRSQLLLSPDKHHLTYTLDNTLEEALVRDITSLKVIKRIKSPSGLFLGDAIYTPDGKFLLIVASNTIFDKPETKRFLLFYDTTNYEVARRLDITSWSPPNVRDDRAINSNVIGTAMAVSPDSRLLAVGYTKEDRKALSTTEQAQVVLYNLTTGEEVARASHPPVKQQRSDPFTAKIGKLAFTPDGKYLLSSTYDTRLWQLSD